MALLDVHLGTQAFLLVPMNLVLMSLAVRIDLVVLGPVVVREVVALAAVVVVVHLALPLEEVSALVDLNLDLPGHRLGPLILF